VNRNDLRRIDLHLLVVFESLMHERNLTRTAEKLFLGQPAISAALVRLRQFFDDPLLVRSGRAMEPTPRALAILKRLRPALDGLSNALSEVDDFDPGASRAVFRIGMSDIGEIYFLPRLITALAEAAPGVTVSTVRNAAVDLKHEMENGHVDLAIGLLPQLKAGFFQRRLFMQRYVCVFGAGHPLASKSRLSLKDFTSADHVLIQAAGTGHGQVDELMAAQGIVRRVRLTVPHFVAVGQILRSTPMVATVPEKLAQSLAEPFGLVWRTHPAELPQVAINCFWHARFHREPGNQWLRSLLFDTFVEP